MAKWFLIWTNFDVPIRHHFRNEVIATIPIYFVEVLVLITAYLLLRYNESFEIFY